MRTTGAGYRERVPDDASGPPTAALLTPAALTAGPVRAVRSVAVAGLIGATALSAHLAAGGAAPADLALLAAGPIAVGACWRLSARRWSVRDLLGLFLVAQAAVHVLAMLAPAAGAVDQTRAAPMAISHVLGALVLVVLVQHGEGVLWTLTQHLGLRAAGLLDAPSATGTCRSVPVLARTAEVVPGPERRVCRGRSPPR
ncbi:hypothetical protein CLV56_2307 [Mumia flava]|uniref:Uncharacterized protein n=1 Tax=Mumia flava TaxID=1348852 RepID=A0A0B2BQV3_9ACTN|nr:hypothetical protein [Mumia flava]PJJ58062.1 hypothetical protein CLV56_2307 [Mumia flava]